MYVERFRDLGKYITPDGEDMIATEGYLVDELEVSGDPGKKYAKRETEHAQLLGLELDLIRVEDQLYDSRPQLARPTSSRKGIGDRPPHISAEEWARVLRDRDAFMIKKEELCLEYEGKWVAVYQEEVVDSDTDRARLVARIAKDYCGISVFVGGCGVQRPRRVTY